MLRTALEAEHAVDLNPKFHGTTRTSVVTGKTEMHYRSSHRWATQGLVTVPVTAFLLAVALVTLALTLNLQGLVDESSPIYVEMLSRYTKPGRIFDKDHAVFSLIPVCLSSGAIFALATMYRSVATWLTHLENWKHLQEFESQLICKRFFFDVVCYFFGLFYVAFYELDIVNLRDQLIAIFMVDTARRVATEAVVPYALNHRAQITQWIAKARGKKTDDPEPDDSDADSERLRGDEVVAEYMQDEYESYDDYIEMVVQLGYITLFAAAFPLAAPLSLAANFVEIRTDGFKLAFNTRRPHAVRANNIGPWEKIVEAMVWMSVLTNVVLAGLASNQLRTLFPSFGDGGRPSFFLMASIEHALLLVGVVLSLGVRTLPANVRDDVNRREYEKKQALSMEAEAQAVLQRQAERQKRRAARRAAKQAAAGGAGGNN